jgi:hypothetical protein
MSKSRWRPILVATVLWSGLGALIGVVVTRAQELGFQPNIPPPLSLEDYIEIQQLVAHYPYPLDTNPDHGKSYAANFTEDGIFHDQHDWYYRGHKDITHAANFDRRPPSPNNVGHFIFSHEIWPTANGGAIGHEQNFLISEIGPPDKDGWRAASIVSYQYDDIYEKTPTGWKFKVRAHIRPGADPPEHEGDLWHIRSLDRP